MAVQASVTSVELLRNQRKQIAEAIGAHRREVDTAREEVERLAYETMLGVPGSTRAYYHRKAEYLATLEADLVRKHRALNHVDRLLRQAAR